MKVEEKGTPPSLSLEFEDIDGRTVEISAQSPEHGTYPVPTLCFSLVSDWRVFTQEQMKALLPYLERFVGTGRLEGSNL